MAKKQGTYATEDESRKVRGKSNKKAARDEKYGDWGKRKTDWKNHQQG